VASPTFAAQFAKKTTQDYIGRADLPQRDAYSWMVSQSIENISTMYAADRRVKDMYGLALPFALMT